LNSDAALYGGSNIGNQGGLTSEPIPAHGRPHSVSLTVPPLAGLILKKKGSEFQGSKVPGFV